MLAGIAAAVGAAALLPSMDCALVIDGGALFLSITKLTLAITQHNLQSLLIRQQDFCCSYYRTSKAADRANYKIWCHLPFRRVPFSVLSSFARRATMPRSLKSRWSMLYVPFFTTGCSSLSWFRTSSMAYRRQYG